MRFEETPILFSIVVVEIIIWIILAVTGFVYALSLRRDAQKDIDARHEMNINSGREILAQLVLTMSKAKAVAFFVWFFAGTYAISPWALTSTGPQWRRVIVPTALVVGELALFYSLHEFQSKRRFVLNRDIALEENRLKENTVALQENTQAMKDVTMVIQEQTGDGYVE